MKKYKIKDGFKCDRQSKYDFTASTVNYLESIYPNKEITLVFKELDEDGNLVNFGSKNVSKTSSTDLVMFFNDIKYVIELKERWGKYHSTYYNDWMLNIDKVEALTESDGIPLYVNLYPDEKVRIWNLNKITDFQTITKDIHKTTVVESEIKRQDRYVVWNKNSKLIKRIKGKKSNGIYKKGVN